MQSIQSLGKQEIRGEKTIFSRIAWLKRRVGFALGVWWHRRRLVRELQGLPDRLLDDSGIGRHEIYRHADLAARSTMAKHYDD